MNGIALALVTIVLLTLAGGFFAIGELEDRCREENKKMEDEDGSEK